MTLETGNKIVVGASAIGSGLAVATLVLSSVKATFNYRGETFIYLTLNVSEGGTTVPEKGIYEYTSTGKVILTAVPQSGYVFNGWYVKGILLSSDLSYSYNLTESVVISASFVKEGSPTLIPSFITPFQKTKAVVTHRWRLWKEAFYNELGIFNCDIIHFKSEAHEVDTVQFKLCDKNGNGVPNQSIAVYTDNMPDATVYGTLIIADNRDPNSPFMIHTLGNPLILTTDANGTVEVLCAYVWYEPTWGEESKKDYMSTLGRSGRLKWTCWAAWGWSSPFWDLMKSPTYWYVPPIPIPIAVPTGWAEWQLLVDPIYRSNNLIHAHWVDNPNLFNMGACGADCKVTMMQSTTNIPTV